MHISTGKAAMTDDREKLARALVKISKNDPDQLVLLSTGETTPLWEIAARAMDKLPKASLRTALDARARKTDGAGLSASRLLQGYLSFKELIHGGWISPKDRLPPRSNEDDVLSEVVSVKRHGTVREGQLLYGTPIGSHRWVFGAQEFAHVLDIQGWKHIKKKDTP